jgi:predicted ArsR family transcriptional regulator
MDAPDPSARGVLAQPTRARIFALLVELRGAAGTEELARRLDLHPNGVRRHLERMMKAGLVERRRPRGGRGRPRDRWCLAPDAHPGGERPAAYADLAGWLARAIPAGSRRLSEIERTGREIGRELAPRNPDDRLEGFRRTLTALGFQPQLEAGVEGELRCRLGNCPYRDAVRENAEVVCTLHRGITVGLLAELEPNAALRRFEPHDPDRAGCLVEIGGGEWHGPTEREPSPSA